MNVRHTPQLCDTEQHLLTIHMRGGFNRQLHSDVPFLWIQHTLPHVECDLDFGGIRKGSERTFGDRMTEVAAVFNFLHFPLALIANSWSLSIVYSLCVEQTTHRTTYYYTTDQEDQEDQEFLWAQAERLLEE
jgi:hypothetical protein